MTPQLPPRLRRALVKRIRPVAGFLNRQRRLAVRSRDGGEVLILGIYLADRPHQASHLVQRFSSAKYWRVTQKWIALNGAPDSPELAAVTVERVEGRVPKFTLMNRLLSEVDLREYDYILFCDDDITVPHHFLDAFLGYQVAHDFALAQPARTPWSIAHHRFGRQKLGLEARLTRFVEIGPVFSVRKDFASTVLPFDESSPMGWGYDLVWPVQAERAGMRIGLVDATPVDHSMRGQAVEYSHDSEWQVMERFLEQREHLKFEEAHVILEPYKRRLLRWPFT